MKEINNPESKEKPEDFEQNNVSVEEREPSANEWKCPDCGRINQHYVGTCGCGHSRTASNNTFIVKPSVKKAEKAIISDNKPYEKHTENSVIKEPPREETRPENINFDWDSDDDELAEQGEFLVAQDDYDSIKIKKQMIKNHYQDDCSYSVSINDDRVGIYSVSQRASSGTGVYRNRRRFFDNVYLQLGHRCTKV